MNSIRFLILASLLLFNVTATYIPLSVAEGPFVIGDIDLLSGYKTNVAAGENPLRNKVFEGDIRTYLNPYTDFQIQLYDSKKTEEDVMDFEGELTANFIIITATAHGHYYKEKVTTRNEFKYLYRVRREVYRKKVENVDVRSFEALVKKQNLTANEIAEKYGSKFIKEIVYGVELDLMYTATFKKDVDLKGLEARFEACLLGILCISFSFGGIEGFSREEFSESFSARVSGSEFTVPVNPNFAEVKQLIHDFENITINDTGQETNVLKKLSPIGFVLGSISDYKNDVDFGDLDRRTKKLSKVLSSSIFLKEKLIAMRARQKFLYSDPRDKALLFALYNDAVESVLEDLNAKIEECLEYQRSPLKEILGSNVPEPYEKNVTVLDGLLGNLYLPNVMIGKTIFIKMHYVGFGLVVDGVLKPWLSGSIRYDDIDEKLPFGGTVYKIVATARRPEDLERLAFKEINFDQSRVRIRAAHQVTSSEMIGPQFKLGEWTTPSFKGAKNLQQFEFVNLGTLILEAEATFNVTGKDVYWTTGYVGEIGGNATKKMESFRLRIKSPYYSVSYQAKLEDGNVTSVCSDGDLCGKKDSGNGINAINVTIQTNQSTFIACDDFSLCRCEVSICYVPFKSEKHI